MISNKTEYALRALTELASSDRMQKSGEIAERQNIPRKFLPHILSDLARSGLIRTARGFGGGIVLAHRPRDITLKSVVEAVQGPIVAYECLIGTAGCGLSEGCVLRPVWQRVQSAVDQLLMSVTLEDILSEQKSEVRDGDT